MRRIVLFAGLVLGLSACQIELPKLTGASTAPTEVGIVGDAIEVTSLDAAPVAAPDPAALGEPKASPSPDPSEKAPAEANATEEAVAAEEATAPEEEVVAKTPAQIACERRKGIWEKAASGAAFFCQMPTGDGGKQCRKSTDCEGYCLARSGTCAPISPMFGCQDILNEDGRMLTECIN